MLSINQLGAHSCRWATSAHSSRHHTFDCRKPAVAGRPYCSDHCYQAFQATDPSRRREASRFRKAG
jgi:hypothetical protein